MLEKGSMPKGKNLLPRETFVSFLVQTPFQKRGLVRNKANWNSPQLLFSCVLILGVTIRWLVHGIGVRTMICDCGLS